MRTSVRGRGGLFQNGIAVLLFAFSLLFCVDSGVAAMVLPEQSGGEYPGDHLNRVMGQDKQTAESPTKPYKDGELLVKFKPKLSKSSRDNAQQL